MRSDPEPPPLSLPPPAVSFAEPPRTPGSPSKQRSRPAPPNLYRMIYDPDIVKNLFVRILLLFIITLVTHKRMATPLKTYYGLEKIDGDGFGVMQAVVGLVFSVMIGQTYEYYFARQGAIQDAAFEESVALWRLWETLGATLADERALRSGERMIKAYADHLLDGGLSNAATLIVELDIGGKTVKLGDLLRLVADGPITSESAAAAVHQTLRDVHRCAAKRISNINADLPLLQWRTLETLALFIGASFSLVSLDNEWVEAVVFSSGVAATALFYFVLRDLSDPFSGHWSVMAAEEAIHLLSVRIDGPRSPQPVPKGRTPIKNRSPSPLVKKKISFGK